MNQQPVPLIFSGEHRYHHPPVEYFHHRLLPYAEAPERADLAWAHLSQTGLAAPVEIATALTPDELAAVHDTGMIAALAQAAHLSADVLAGDPAYYQTSLDDGADDVYFYPSVFRVRSAMRRLRDVRSAGYYAFDVFAPIGRGTWRAAAGAAAVAATGADHLRDGAPLVYALCRPPGHHAGHDFMGGYCYLNNAAIAAQRLLELGRIAIIDLDYHHGNGTQDIFWDNPDVFFGSIHADPVHEYPYYAGFADETGGPNAPDTNLNLPLALGTDGPMYQAALLRLLDAVETFNPAALVISMGFDTYQDDHLCAFELCPADYAQIGARLSALERPTLFVHEGGYHAAACGSLAEQLIRGFLNQDDLRITESADDRDSCA